jgi:rRNA processing protein Krr1/Pno1
MGNSMAAWIKYTRSMRSARRFVKKCILNNDKSNVIDFFKKWKSFISTTRMTLIEDNIGGLETKKNECSM